MAELKLYPVGIQTFEEIITRNLLYVDKTEYVYRMTHSGGKHFFLSRPRRFGKSLLVSTFKSYFLGKKELFKGLAIEKLEKDWTEYPVLHFSMAGGKHMEKDQLERYLDFELNKLEKLFGIDTPRQDPNTRLADLIIKAYQQTGKQVVVLIDEYDAPLLDVVHEDSHLKDLRNVMRNFYSPLKDCEPMLRFVFLTGITKFSQMSIFSELNNITNISMDHEYAGICGITKEELETQMSADVDALAVKMNLTRTQTLDALREFYDGYHFASNMLNVYNPYSVLSAFSRGKLNSYWIASGSNEMLFKILNKFAKDIPKLDNCLIDADYLEESDVNMIDPKLFLYQAGYLTIKAVDGDTYTLGYPNKETKDMIKMHTQPVKNK